MELLDCAGDAKSLWLFWKGILFLHFLPLAGQRPLLGGGRGGNNAKPWQSVSRVGFAGGAEGGDMTPQPSPLLCGNMAPWV